MSHLFFFNLAKQFLSHLTQSAFFFPPAIILCLLFFCRHQGFGVLSVVLANHAIKLLSSLFQDLQVEALHKVCR